MLRFPPKRIVFSRGGASVVACPPAWHVAVQDAELEILIVPFWHSRVTQYENELASGLCDVNRCRLLRLELAFVLATTPLPHGHSYCWLVCLPFKQPSETSDRVLSSRQDILSMTDLTAQATRTWHMPRSPWDGSICQAYVLRITDQSPQPRARNRVSALRSAKSWVSDENGK